ncbi:MAG: polysaccharide biosynthesis/export family protein [Verrucomicrobiota bacterium]|jgi:polysaccharide export outer membrane protein
MKSICAWLAVGLLLGCGLGAGLALTGCSSPKLDPTFFDQPVSPNSGPASAENAARLHMGDTVIVTLAGIPGQDTTPPHQEVVSEEGLITMPDIGPVKAAGKTASQLQNDIHDLYVPRYYTHLTVTVNIGERVYYVSGEVKNPSRYVYAGETTVSGAIATAGDFSEFANHKNVVLTRANKQIIKVNVDRVRSGKAEDPAVYPGDSIYVHRRIW